MACSGCSKRAQAKRSKNLEDQAKYMNNRQLKARLESYKRQYCKDCDRKSSCTYETYVSCKKRIK